MKLSNLNLISHYRTEIMGAAILGIMLFHSGLSFSSSLFVLTPFNALSKFAYGGVDIFFLVSGFGLACGWTRKKYRLIDFYGKRFSRILPTYLLTAIAYFLIFCITFKSLSFRNFILQFSGLNFALAKSYDWWFVPGILFFYLLFPLIVWALIKFLLDVDPRKKTTNFLLLTIFIPLLLSITLSGAGKGVLLILSIRLSNFILGVFLGIVYSSNQDQIQYFKSILNLRVMFALGLLLLFFIEHTPESYAWKYGLWWYPLIFITFPLTLLIGNTFKLLQKSNLALFLTISRFFQFLGNFSYEIFLSHSLVFSIFFYLAGSKSFFENYNLNGTDIFWLPLIIAISLLLAPVMRYISNALLYSHLSFLKLVSRKI